SGNERICFSSVSYDIARLRFDYSMLLYEGKGGGVSRQRDARVKDFKNCHMFLDYAPRIG
ncbi:MAG: hypothetical protein K2H73_03460, partial [Treponemataceae bacterium]|nr:hypothetical protein [Treponemataceae bacterium]